MLTYKLTYGTVFPVRHAAMDRCRPSDPLATALFQTLHSLDRVVVIDPLADGGVRFYSLARAHVFPALVATKVPRVSKPPKPPKPPVAR